jgi:hypothetical protein
MPIRGSPNGADYLHPQAGRDRLESVVAINRNGWSQSIGMAGRDRPVRALIRRSKPGSRAIGPHSAFSTLLQCRGASETAVCAVRTHLVVAERDDGSR